MNFHKSMMVPPNISKDSVVVVNKQMPRGRLKFGGRWTLEDSGRDYALKSTHEETSTHTVYPGSGLS